MALFQSRVIAIVDDSEPMRAALRDLVQAMGFSCRVFGSATDFLEEYAQCEFGCLITDVRMPEMTGLELQKRLRQLGSRIPVIILTSCDDPFSRIVAAADGALAFMTKPVDDKDLLRQLKNVFGDAAT